ncbi:class B sortase [Candidatus Contubernalis alkaliaceticus]|uniref:class B sortase n=1 Tax=Candidatus Contubernalis alkaliaceticus TaxID=338645 RepID=UPI001F4BF9C5|nr:class B sortase [Candidatus Contubernalis alkalaceticus]UNC93080.1 class B sortase [Candidatus Contubernalis alkalaceticus]
MKKALAVVWVSLLIATIYGVSTYYFDSVSNKRLYEEVKMQYYEGISQEDNVEKSAVVISNDENSSAIMDRYLFIMEENQDIVGWITIPETRINYPVVKIDNNDFYLDHNINKKPAKAGAIFMDFRNEGKGEDLHTVLYGHNMKDGSMFKDLLNYSNESFLNQYGIIRFDTLYEEIEWEIFSVYVTDTDFYYIETEFASGDDYLLFLKGISERSLFKTDIHPSVDNVILTLSTCSYDFEDARFVVHARRI